jgi:hypothetical protein
MPVKSPLVREASVLWHKGLSILLNFIADMNVRILPEAWACLVEVRSMQLWVTEPGEHTKTSRRRDMPRS